MTDYDIVQYLFDMRCKAKAKTAIAELCKRTNLLIFEGKYTALKSRTDNMQKDCFDEWYMMQSTERFYIDFGHGNINKVISEAVMYVIENLGGKGLILDYAPDIEEKGTCTFTDRLTGRETKQKSYVQKITLDCSDEETFYDSFKKAFAYIRAVGKKGMGIW